MNTPFTLSSFHSLAFAQQNPVLPNYEVGQHAIEPARILDNRSNLASSVAEPASKPHYQPITPSASYYMNDNNSEQINSYSISATDAIKPTPTSLIQPISSTNYQPITPAANSADSTKSIDSSEPVQHEPSSGNEGYNGVNSKDKDNDYHETSSSSGEHNHHESDNGYSFGPNDSHDSHKLSSNHYNDNTQDRTNNHDDHHNRNGYGSHHNDDEEGSSTIIISSDNDYGDYEHDDHPHNYHHDSDNDNNNDEGISMESSSSSGAFASAGDTGAFASAG
jgi:hypothetical protein